ncbi:Guanine nucleotide exchange factor LTE1 [Bienertia sinuspersici]
MRSKNLKYPSQEKPWWRDERTTLDDSAERYFQFYRLTNEEQLEAVVVTLNVDALRGGTEAMNTNDLLKICYWDLETKNAKVDGGGEWAGGGDRGQVVELQGDASLDRSIISLKAMIRLWGKVDWGGSTMIQAERILLKNALLDPANERFVFLSDSCVPLYNFSYTYDYIMSTSTSFVDSFADTKEGRYNPKMHPIIPVNNWRKGSQWVTLNRKHAEIVVNDEIVFPVFQQHCKVNIRAIISTKEQFI